MDADRATSFGTAAADYDRYRPAPPAAVVTWMLPAAARRVVDVGAGTGGFSRVLAATGLSVTAVELDFRMAAVAASRSDGVTVVNARAEALPVRAASVDAVVVSSAWHWMDAERALAEAARVLVDGGTLGVVWNGPARNVEWVARLLARRRRPDQRRRVRQVSIPPGLPFSEPQHEVIRWSLPRTPAELIGLAGTYSRVLTLDPPGRRAVARRAAQVVDTHPSLRRRTTVELPMAARCWRMTRLPRSSKW